MARIKPEEIIEHLDRDMRVALEIAVKQVLPEAEFDSMALFRAFVLAVDRQCSQWERVPDRFVEKD
jgi:hypothetical protein